MTSNDEGGAGAHGARPPCDLLAGRYRLVRPLGSGGMGEVYLGDDEQLGRRVAVKLLPAELASDPRRLARFRREGRLAANLSHPGICTVFEVGEEGGRPFIVMEHVEGQSLRHRVADGPLPLIEVVDVGLQVADALTEAHSHGLVHRDLKSGNIVLTTRRQVKILDFGLAKRLPEAASRESSTESLDTAAGAVVGTLPYVSPEQALGWEVDHRSDLFSLGVVLYELTTGMLPFQGRSGAEVVDRIIHGEPSSMSRFAARVPDELERIIRKLLAKDPDDRYQAARELAVDLRRLRAASSANGRGAEPWLPGRVRRRRRLAVGGVVLGSAAILISFVALRAPTGVRVGKIRLEPITHTTAPGLEEDPALSPDGTQVAYAAETDGNVDLWLMDSTGGQAVRLTDHPAMDFSPVWMPNGRELLFVSDRGGTPSLWRVGRFGGSPRPVVEDALEPAVSPDGSRVAFSRRGRACTRVTIWVAPIDATDTARQITPHDLGIWDHESPAFSPDGRTLAFADLQDVWLVAADGSGSPRRITDGLSTYRDPEWFPDGRSLMITSWRGGTVALWTVRTDGSDLVRVTTGTGSEREPSLSRDGTMVAYEAHQLRQDVVVTDLATGHRERLASSAYDASPEIRPDGSAVVFSSDRSGDRQLWLQRLADGLPAGPPRQLTSGPARAAMPSFSPDGETVAFSRIEDQQRALWVVPARGGPARQLTDGSPGDVSPSFSPDGRRLVFARVRGGGSEIWVLDLEAGGGVASPRPLITGPVDASCPVWSPVDGRLAYRADDDVWVVDLAGCAAEGVEHDPGTRLTRGAGARDLAWTSDGRALLVSGTWGGDRLELREVPLDDPEGGEELVFQIGDWRGEGTFGLSRDGRYVTSILGEARSDVWVARVVR